MFTFEDIVPWWQRLEVNPIQTQSNIDLFSMFQSCFNLKCSQNGFRFLHNNNRLKLELNYSIGEGGQSVVVLKSHVQKSHETYEICNNTIKRFVCVCRVSVCVWCLCTVFWRHRCAQRYKIYSRKVPVKICTSKSVLGIF